MSATFTLWPGSDTEHPLGICAWLWWRDLFTFKFLLTQDYPEKCGWAAPGTHCWSQRLLKGNMHWGSLLFRTGSLMFGQWLGKHWGMHNSFTHDSFISGMEKTCETSSNMFTHIKQGMFPPTKSVRTEMCVYANGKWSKPRGSLVSLCQNLFQLSFLGKVHQTGIAVTWESKCLTSLVLARTYRERGREHKSWLPPLPFHTIHNNP